MNQREEPEELISALKRLDRGQEEIEGLLSKSEKEGFFDLRLHIGIARELEQQFRGHRLFRVFIWGCLGENGSINVRFSLAGKNKPARS